MIMTGLLDQPSGQQSPHHAVNIDASTAEHPRSEIGWV
jgi:hypothetical protein